MAGLVDEEILFQSLVGFKINWNARYTTRIPPTEMFQSLVGFKINWNLLSFQV